MKNSHRGQGEVGFVILGLIVIAVVGWGIWQLMAYKTVDAGNVGIVVNYRNGTMECPNSNACAENEKIRQPRITTHYPGSRFYVSPRHEKYYQYPVSEQTISIIRHDNNGGVQIQDNAGNGLHVDVSMFWAVDQQNVSKLFLARKDMKLVGGDNGNDIETQIVQRELVRAVTIAAGKYRFDELFGSKRVEFGEEVDRIVREGLDNSYINVNRVVVGVVHPNAQQSEAIVKNADAQQAAIRAQYLEQQRKNEAAAAVAEAEGKRQIAEKEAQGEADRIRTINNAISSSPEYMKWLIINKWDGKQPSTVVFGDGSTNYSILVPTP